MVGNWKETWCGVGMALRKSFFWGTMEIGKIVSSESWVMSFVARCIRIQKRVYRDMLDDAADVVSYILGALGRFDSYALLEEFELIDSTLRIPEI